MGNSDTMPKKKPTLKRTRARKTPEKKHNGLPITAAAKKNGLKKLKADIAEEGAAEKKKYARIAAPNINAIAHVFPGPDRNTAIVCYRDPTTGRYDLNCHPVPVSQLGTIFPRRRG